MKSLQENGHNSELDLLQFQGPDDFKEIQKVIVTIVNEEP